jgi:hypothetical protein
MKVSVTTEESKDRIFSFHIFHMSKYLEQILNKDWLQVIKFFENLSFSKWRTMLTSNSINMYKSTDISVYKQEYVITYFHRKMSNIADLEHYLT